MESPGPWRKRTTFSRSESDRFDERTRLKGSAHDSLLLPILCCDAVRPGRRRRKESEMRQVRQHLRLAPRRRVFQLWSGENPVLSGARTGPGSAGGSLHLPRLPGHLRSVRPPRRQEVRLPNVPPPLAGAAPRSAYPGQRRRIFAPPIGVARGHRRLCPGRPHRRHSVAAGFSSSSAVGAGRSVRASRRVTLRRHWPRRLTTSSRPTASAATATAAPARAASTTSSTATSWWPARKSSPATPRTPRFIARFLAARCLRPTRAVPCPPTRWHYSSSGSRPAPRRRRPGRPPRLRHRRSAGRP